MKEGLELLFVSATICGNNEQTTICLDGENGKCTGKGKEVEQISCKADWDNPDKTTIFCKLVEEINARNRPLGTLNARCYKNLGEKFLLKQGKNIPRSS